MDETSKAIIDKISVKYDPPRDIGCGTVCSLFYDCARLSPSDLARLAAEATGHLSVKEFDIVVGIAYTGILFAAAIAGGRQVCIFGLDGSLYGADVKGKKVLVVDDVVFRGTKLSSARKTLEQHGAVVTGYACIIDRSNGQSSGLGKPVWSALQAAL